MMEVPLFFERGNMGDNKFEILNPTTKLEAVNTLLSVIGESPVNTLDDSQLPSVSIAKDEIERVSRQVMVEGLDFNTEIMELSPDEDEYIHIPEGVLRVEPVDCTRNIVWRGDKLYDRDWNTYGFDDNLEVRLTKGISFEDIPEHVRQYIILRAGRVFQDRMVGSETLHQFTRADEQDARLRMYQMEGADMEEIRKVTYEVLSEGFHFNTDVGYKLEPGVEKRLLTKVKNRFQTINEVSYLTKSDLVEIPKNILSITPYEYGKSVVPRGPVLYDLDKQTFKFSSPVKVNIVWLFPFNSIPKYIRQYIRIRGTRRFERKVGYPKEMLSYSEEDEVRARATMFQEDSRYGENNFLYDNPVGRWI